jgi:WXXGXW repeat (2 copies)
MRRHHSVLWLSLALPIVALPVTASAQVICVSNNVPPPELPVYAQPPIPAPGYIWTPGYWAGGPSGYFWVPGTWVEPPAVGLLWTPGYWGWRDGIYTWSAGYWGPHVGFYGGINYGFGYAGAGYEGGHWDNGVFAYNRTVNNFGGVTVTNVYEKTVVVDINARVSFNGGSGGITARPTPEEEAAAHEQHVAAIPTQMQHERTASSDRSLLASENHGKPAIAATSTPGDFSGKGVVAAREAEPKATLVPAKPAGAALTSNRAETKAIGGQERPAIGQKPLNAETKPLNSESKPTNTAGKPPLGNEAKLPNEPKLPNEAKPLITGAKPLNGEAKPSSSGPKPPGAEAKLPNTEPKPQVATPPKGPNSQPPHVAAAPGPAPHPVPAGAPHPKPGSKDKKPPA